MLRAAQSAPAFELLAVDMNLISLADFRGLQNVVLYFYLKDDTLLGKRSTSVNFWMTTPRLIPL